MYETYIGSDVWSGAKDEFDTKKMLNLSEIVITIFFAIDFFLNWFIATHRITYLGTPMALIDLMTITPLLVTLSFRTTANLSQFAIFRLVECVCSGVYVCVSCRGSEDY